MKDKSSLRPTLAYSAVQASYWMTICAAIAFAVVHLQDLGYSNTELGLILAGGNLSGAVLGPTVSARIDRNPAAKPSVLAPVFLSAQALTLLAQLLFPVRGPVMTLAVLLQIGFSLTVNSINLKLYVDCLSQGHSIDFGIARGIGSLAFVFSSIILGKLVTRFSVNILPAAGLLLCLLQLLSHMAMCRFVSYRDGREEQREKASDLLGFFARNRRFCVLLIGTVFLFFAHNSIFNFLINVTKNVGGDTETMGWLNGYIAAVEIPVMLLFSRLRKLADCKVLLRISFLCFILKGTAIALVGSVPALAAAFLLQAPSFALYTAAIVPFVNEEIPFEDSAKAQSLMYTMTTVGTVLSSVISGRLFDIIPVRSVIWISVAAAFIGAVIAAASLHTGKTGIPPKNT
ncbi:MAG: MFS transporter [Oscillospiraceae bacterium]|nr:MFS transporter [Oscillospiraceae bacterium]